jgi:uncharacterized protein YgiM (DUF1202 family)
MRMKRLLSYALVVGMVFASVTVYAKTINLYSEPKTTSTVAGKVDTEASVTIIYTPKNSEWIKVANPNNGDVGWVKSSDLGGNGYNMRIITSDDGTHSYNIYQLGSGSSQYNQQQLDKEMQQFEQQQRIMQIHMAHMFNDMFYFPQPIFIPVVMVPEQPQLQKTPPAKTPQPTQIVPTSQTKKS